MGGTYESARRKRGIVVVGGVLGGTFLSALMVIVALTFNSDIVCFSAIGVFLLSFFGGLTWATLLQQKQGRQAAQEVASQLGLSASSDGFEGHVAGAPVRISSYVHRSSSETRDFRVLLQVSHPRDLGLDLSIRGRVMLNSPRPGTWETRFGHPELDSWLYIDCRNPQATAMLLTPSALGAIHWLVSWSAGKAWFRVDDQTVTLDFDLDHASPEQVVEGARRIITLRETLFGGLQQGW
jgi:hypothetical protein